MANPIPNLSGSATQILNGIQDHLHTRVWYGRNDQEASDNAAGPVLEACMRLERIALRKHGLDPDFYEGELAGEWANRILKGPGFPDGLRSFDPAKPLGLFIACVIDKRVISILRSAYARRKLTFKLQSVMARKQQCSQLEEVRDDSSPFDAREHREIILLAIERHVAELDPGSTAAAVARVVRDHVAEFLEWPSYQTVAEKLGLAPRYACTLRNDAIKAISRRATSRDLGWS